MSPMQQFKIALAAFNRAATAFELAVLNHGDIESAWATLAASKHAMILKMQAAKYHPQWDQYLFTAAIERAKRCARSRLPQDAATNEVAERQVKAREVEAAKRRERAATQRAKAAATHETAYTPPPQDFAIPPEAIPEDEVHIILEYFFLILSSPFLAFLVFETNSFVGFFLAILYGGIVGYKRSKLSAGFFALCEDHPWCLWGAASPWVAILAFVIIG